MTPNPYTLGPRDTLASLYDLMDTHRIRHVPIVDQDKELVGLLTHTDLAMSALSSWSDLPLSQERDLLQRRRVRESRASRKSPGASRRPRKGPA
ncbi:MAG TPA: CBS domain-containing protein [Thermoanaerobaculia bacterium]|jgi:CBS domain-containing protein